MHGYQFSNDAARIDRELVHLWISQQSYWAPGRSREKQDAAMEGSRNYGIYDEITGQQVAYARIITDGATFAYLCDVFVAPEVRGHGVGTMLIAEIVAECEPLGLRRIALVTSDAHRLYEPSGFDALTAPGRWMELVGDPSA